jgi:CheY-like chemotaxis protein
MNNPVILVLDTDADNGEMLRSVVHPDHHEIRVVTAEAEALRVVEEEEEIALVFIQGSLPLAIECIETWKTEPATRAIPLVLLATASDLTGWLSRLPERARPEHHLLLPLQAEDLVPLLEFILGPDSTWDSEPVFDAIPIDTPDEEDTKEEEGTTDEVPPAKPAPEKTPPPAPVPPPPPLSIDDRIDGMTRDLLALNRRYEEVRSNTERLEAAHQENREAWEQERATQSTRVAELLAENAALTERMESYDSAVASDEEPMAEHGNPTTLAALEEWKKEATRALHAARKRVQREEEQQAEMSAQLKSAHEEIAALQERMGGPSPTSEASRAHFRTVMKQLQSATLMLEQAKARVNAGRHHLDHRMEVVRGLNSIWERLSSVQRSYAADASTRSAAHHLENVLGEMRDRLRELSTIMSAADRMAEAHSETVEQLFLVLANGETDA